MSGGGIFATEQEKKNLSQAPEIERQQKEKSLTAAEKQKTLTDKSILRNSVQNEVVNNYNVSQSNSKDPNIQQLQNLYNQLDQVRNGVGVSAMNEQQRSEEHTSELSHT